MKLHYFHRQLNFGDHLNTWMWERLLPGCFDDPDDGLVMTGIGTIIGHTIPATGRILILGSGAGSTPPPADFPGPRWNVLAVRGPLSARLLDLPEDRAVADAAVVLRGFPEAAPVSEAERHGVVYVPHLSSADVDLWRGVMQEAGIEYLDVRQDSRVFLERLRHARLVLAEAMHAAIVADVVRVPWIPVVTNTWINSFKWMDWLETVDIPYRPVKLPEVGLTQQLQRAILPALGYDFFNEFATPEEALRDARARMTRIDESKASPRKRLLERLFYRVVQPLAGRVERSPLGRRYEARLLGGLIERLLEIKEMPPYLSDERTLARLDERLRDRVEEARRIYARERVPAATSA